MIEVQSKLPYLTRDNVRLDMETWKWDRLVELVSHPNLKTEKETYDPSGPVVVVRWAGSDYLVDGRKRINHWIRVGGVEQSQVIVVLHQHDI